MPSKTPGHDNADELEGESDAAAPNRTHGLAVNQTSTETQLNSILSLVPDAIITIDEDGTIASFNAAAERLFGYGATEAIGRNVKMLMPSPYREEHDGYLAHHRKTGEKKIIGIGRQVEAQRKDGLVFPIILSVNEMTVDGRRMFTGVVHDISELQKSQAAVGQLAEIIEESVNEIFVCDSETYKIINANRAARNNLGYSREEAANLTPLEFVVDLDRNNIEQLLESIRTDALKSQVFEAVHRRKDGTTYPVSIQLQLMRTQRPPVYLAIVQDITELKQKDALLRQSQKMEVIGQLTGGIAHDFNNLLTVILGNNELLAGRLGDDDRARKFLDAASGAAERGAQLTSQLLSFARQQPLDAKVIDVNALAFGMQDMLQRTLGETIIVELDLAPDLGKAQADPAQLHNALLNLAINAKDAMPNGGRLIIETSNINFDPAAAKTCVDVEAGHYVRLSVSDTGCGMPPDVQARVFEPFFTTKEKGKGTGLGLSMVQGFAKQSGGHLDLYSEPGHGTTVNIYLPDASADAELISPDDAPSPTMDAQGETVLVVEDDYRVRHITVARLEHLGYQVVEAENGQQALDVLGDGYTVDVVLTDMVMPGGMTGADLIRHVREKYPQMKIGFTSGYAEGSQLPVDGAPWLYKPYAIDELARTLRQLLD